MNIEIKDEQFLFLPEKALIWKRKNLLIFSDVHLGKAESFQSFGIPIPSKINLDDLNKIAELIKNYQIKEVLILGDLIHHKSSWTEDLFLTLLDFLKFHKEVNFKLLLGNHEQGSNEYLKELPIEMIPGDYELPPFNFSHGHNVHSEKDKKPFTIQGHIHPVVVLHEGPIRLRLPCFVLNHHSLILPSFGQFTGGFEIKPRKEHRIFAVTKRIIELT